MAAESSEFISDERAELAAQLPAARWGGQSFAWVGGRPPGSDYEVIVKFLTSPHWPFSPGPRPFPEAVGTLRAITQDEATRRLREWLHRGLSYRVEIIQAEAASQLASMFVGLLGPGASWRTNLMTEWTDGNSEGATWNVLTDATFEAGVIGVDEDSLAITWFTEED